MIHKMNHLVWGGNEWGKYTYYYHLHYTQKKKHCRKFTNVHRVNLHTIAIIMPAPDVLTGCHGEGCHRMFIAPPQLSITADPPQQCHLIDACQHEKRKKKKMKLN